MGKKTKIKKTFVVSSKDGVYEINKPQDLSYGIPDKWKNYPVKIIKPTLNSTGGEITKGADYIKDLID